MSRGRWIAVVVLLLLTAASLSCRTKRSFDIVDTEGRPVIAYLAYRYQGSVMNFVHPATYNASAMALVRTDRDGRATMPAAIHAHLPFPIQTHPTLWVEMVYAPGQHNAWARFGDRSIARPETFEFDSEGRRVVLADLGNRPEMWEGTLINLSSMIQRVVPTPFRRGARLRDRDAVTADLALELIERFRLEYQAFLARHGDAVRPMPNMPPMWTDDDKRRWAEMVKTDLSNEPTWGARAKRLFGSYSTLFREYEEELR